MLLQKRKRRAGMIDKLRKSKDPLVQKFSEKELWPIEYDNRYHSPEESETDSDDQSRERKIVVRDLKWRSTIVS